MNKFTKMLNLARQKFVIILRIIPRVTALLLVAVSLWYGIVSVLPILLIFIIVVVVLWKPDHERRRLASIYIVVNSIFDVAKYTFLFWPMAISLTYALLGDMCRLSTGDMEGCKIPEIDNMGLRLTVVAINFLVAFFISILFAYTYSKNFRRLMKVLSPGGKVSFLTIVVPLVLLSAVFMNDFIRGDSDLFGYIVFLGYMVLITFLLFILFVTTSLKIAVKSRHHKR